MRTPLTPPGAVAEPVARRVISVVVQGNPKRAGTAAFRKFSELRDGMAVDEFLALEGQRPEFDANRGWAALELRTCLKRGYIAIVDVVEEGTGA